MLYLNCIKSVKYDELPPTKVKKKKEKSENHLNKKAIIFLLLFFVATGDQKTPNLIT
jgi:hypothetical protein